MELRINKAFAVPSQSLWTQHLFLKFDQVSKPCLLDLNLASLCRNWGVEILQENQNSPPETFSQTFSQVRPSTFHKFAQVQSLTQEDNFWTTKKYGEYVVGVVRGDGDGLPSVCSVDVSCLALGLGSKQTHTKIPSPPNV